MHTIMFDNVEIPFDYSWNNIAISVSGGADSALLAYLLCSFATDNQNIHIINHIRMWKTRPWQQYDAINVYEYLLSNFPRLNFKLHKNFIAPDLEYGNIGPSLIDEYGKRVSGDNIQQRSYAEYICNKYNIDAYYNAVTRNPKNTDLKGMKERDIDPNNNNDHLRIMKHMNKWAIHPFRFIDKSWIIKQYKTLDIMDLFNITRSCEGEFDNLNYNNYVPNQLVPICGKCFWCKEREWAIEQNK